MKHSKDTQEVKSGNFSNFSPGFFFFRWQWLIKHSFLEKCVSITAEGVRWIHRRKVFFCLSPTLTRKTSTKTHKLISFLSAWKAKPCFPPPLTRKKNKKLKWKRMREKNSPTLYVRRTKNKQEEFMELSEWVNCQNIRKFHVLHMFLTFSTFKRTRKRRGTPWKSVAVFRPPAIHPSELSRERQIVEISFHSFENFFKSFHKLFTK